MTQRTTQKTGIARVENVTVPNPVSLRPFRTFSEVDQPECLYVFRLQPVSNAKPKAMLIPVEDNRWQLTAIASIKEYLAEHTKDIPIIA